MSPITIHRVQPITTIILCTLLEMGTIAIASMAGSVREGKQALRDTKRLTNPLIRKSLERLRIQKLIRFDPQDRTSPIILTPGGFRRARREENRWRIIQSLKQNRWDHLWRLVVFDIPARWKIRHSFRHELRTIGFFPVQYSVYAHPHDCTREIRALAVLHGLKSRVLLFTVPNLGHKEMAARRFFFDK